MSFWDNMIGFSWGEEHLPLLIMVVCIAGVLLHFRREERASLVNTLAFFLLCLFGQFVSGLCRPQRRTELDVALQNYGCNRCAYGFVPATQRDTRDDQALLFTRLNNQAKFRV
jgi:hypothetical protein